MQSVGWEEKVTVMDELAVVMEPVSWPERVFRAMGCQMSVHLALEPTLAAGPLAQAEAMFHEAEHMLSRFREDSELSFVNAHSGEWVQVSALLWQIVDAALQMAEESGGLFDPTMLVALEAAGYGQSFDAMRTDGALAHGVQGIPPVASLRGGYRQVQRREKTHELFLPNGLKLDLGGIAKGYIAQRVVNYLRLWGPTLVDAGGDLVAGDAPPGYVGWPVAVAAPSSLAQGDEADIALVWLTNATLATSGTDYRQWQAQGRTMHHIIDPRRGEPAATNLVSATVLAASAERAECWAKAAIILGDQQAIPQLEALGLAALLVQHNGKIVATSSAQHWQAQQREDGVTRAN